MARVEGFEVLRLGVCVDCAGTGRTPGPDMVRLSLACAISDALEVDREAFIDAFRACRGRWRVLPRRLGRTHRQVDDAIAVAVGRMPRGSSAVVFGRGRA